jgi:hypothetical protein
MSEDAPAVPPELDEPEPDTPPSGPAAPSDPAGQTAAEARVLDEPPRPVNWNLLTAKQAAIEWRELNAWVDWLRHTYGLPASVVPPFWYRHFELVWELSALHTHWLYSYDPEQDGSAGLGWHHDFAEARLRLRDWVAASGTRGDRDRPTRQAVWPGQDAPEPVEETVIADRDADFVAFVNADLARRCDAEQRFYASLTATPTSDDGEQAEPSEAE